MALLTSAATRSGDGSSGRGGGCSSRGGEGSYPASGLSTGEEVEQARFSHPHMVREAAQVPTVLSSFMPAAAAEHLSPSAGGGGGVGQGLVGQSCIGKVRQEAEEDEGEGSEEDGEEEDDEEEDGEEGPEGEGEEGEEEEEGFLGESRPAVAAESSQMFPLTGQQKQQQQQQQQQRQQQKIGGRSPLRSPRGASQQQQQQKGMSGGGVGAVAGVAAREAVRTVVNAATAAAGREAGAGPGAHTGGGQVSAASLLVAPSVVQVQMLSLVVVFSASGLVPLLDILFALFVSLYCIALSRWAFAIPTLPPRQQAGATAAGGGGGRGAEEEAEDSSEQAERLFTGSRWFKAHVVAGAIIGMYLPLSYVLGGFARGDHAAVEGATPHLFLLCCQVLTESVLVSVPRCPLPVRALVPTLYNTRRLFTLMDWTRHLWHGASHTLISAATRVGQGVVGGMGMGIGMGTAGGAGPGMHYSKSSSPMPSNIIPPGGGVGVDGGGVGAAEAMPLPAYAHPGWRVFGQVLAAANLVFWSANLFAFLIPVLLPMAFRRHFDKEVLVLLKRKQAEKLERERERKKAL